MTHRSGARRLPDQSLGVVANAVGVGEKPDAINAQDEHPGKLFGIGMAFNIGELAGGAQPAQHHHLRHHQKAHQRDQCQDHCQQQAIEDVEGDDTCDGYQRGAKLRARNQAEMPHRAVVQQVPDGMNHDGGEDRFRQVIEPARQEQQGQSDGGGGRNR